MKRRKIKKEPLPQSSGRIHKDKDLPDGLIRFSFRHYQETEKFPLPLATEKPAYLETFLQRVRDVSNLTVREFRSNKDEALRAHTHDWQKTSEPNGYAHLTQQLQQCEPWQFCLRKNEFGRIHGILIDEVFYVVWIDHNHALYPG